MFQLFLEENRFKLTFQSYFLYFLPIIYVEIGQKSYLSKPFHNKTVTLNKILIESCFVRISLKGTLFGNNLLHFFNDHPSNFNPFKPNLSAKNKKVKN